MNRHQLHGVFSGNNRLTFAGFNRRQVVKVQREIPQRDPTTAPCHLYQLFDVSTAPRTV